MDFDKSNSQLSDKEDLTGDFSAQGQASSSHRGASHEHSCCMKKAGNLHSYFYLSFNRKNAMKCERIEPVIIIIIKFIAYGLYKK